MIQSGSMSAGGRSSALPSFCCFCTVTAFCVHASHLAFLIGMLYENPEIRGIFPKKGRKKNTA